MAAVPLNGALAMEGPGLSVQGTGQAKLAPDQASLSLSVMSQGQSAQEVQAENARKMQAVTEAVKALGVEDRFIRTSGISLQPQYDYKNGERKLKGYAANNTIRVDVKELAKVQSFDSDVRMEYEGTIAFMGKDVDFALNSDCNLKGYSQFSNQSRRIYTAF